MPNTIDIKKMQNDIKAVLQPVIEANPGVKITAIATTTSEMTGGIGVTRFTPVIEVKVKIELT